jgi:hypothetical protein
MEFTEIIDEIDVFPGEYVYHEPSKAIVMVGAFNKDEDFIRALKHGRLMEDKIAHFKKINLTRREHKTSRVGCGSCKGGK